MPAQANRESDKFMLRFPEGMRDRIKELAAANGRSMNSQVIHMLSFAIDELDLAAGNFADVAGATKPHYERVPSFLRDRIRQSKAMLEQILADFEDPTSDVSKVARERDEGTNGDTF